MSKLKTIVGAHNTICSADGPGQWTWLIDGIKWTWRDGPGDNLSVQVPLLGAHGVCWCKTLDEACVYARGYMRGWYAREAVNAELQKRADKF